jgi:hypothetical protein
MRSWVNLSWGAGHLRVVRIPVIFASLKEPDPKQPGKVFLLIPGGATWSTYYLLRRDGKSADKVTEASRDQLVDLNHDGIYEVMFSSWHNSDERCPFGLTGGGYIEIFQWDGKTFSYRPRWPSGLAAIEDMAQLYDMDGDGAQEIVALMDEERESNKGRKLTIYKLSGQTVGVVSQIDLTSPYTAVHIVGIRRLRDRKQIVLLLADPKSCAEGSQMGDLRITGGGYNFRDGHLELAWLNDKIDITNGIGASLLDIEGDGDEEMLFEDRASDSPFRAKKQAPILLRGEKDFSLKRN